MSHAVRHAQQVARRCPRRTPPQLTGGNGPVRQARPRRQVNFNAVLTADVQDGGCVQRTARGLSWQAGDEGRPVHGWALTGC